MEEDAARGRWWSIVELILDLNCRWRPGNETLMTVAAVDDVNGLLATEAAEAAVDAAAAAAAAEAVTGEVACISQFCGCCCVGNVCRCWSANAAATLALILVFGSKDANCLECTSSIDT